MSAIKIHNSLTRKKEEFRPLKKGRVSMYVCGPTVYDEPHIGHARSAYIFDVIRKYLQYRRYKVTFVRNVTDIDDKIINRAAEEFPGEDLSTAVQKVAAKYLKAYHQAMDELGVAAPDVEPQATSYIWKMTAFIERLIKRGRAYTAGGDVYFDISKAGEYGKLSNQSLEMLQSGARVAADENKRNVLDFALWKKAKPGEPFWESPWGSGRPGWHIECSVMSADILGSEFDIHGGGIDLIFPHHENELAQSEGAGEKFARYWIHNGLLTINGQKMAKSLGNFVTFKEIQERGYPLEALKILFLQAHYSHPVDFNWEKLEEAKKAYERIVILRDKLSPRGAGRRLWFIARRNKEVNKISEIFVEAMNDDFNTPKGLAAIFELINLANKNINNLKISIAAARLLEEALNVFGISLRQSCTATEEKYAAASPNYIQEMITKRNSARKERKYSLADRIRQELEAVGIILEDTPDGTTWRRKL